MTEFAPRPAPRGSARRTRVTGAATPLLGHHPPEDQGSSWKPLVCRGRTAWKCRRSRGGDLADPELLGDGDDSRVGGPEWEVGVGLDQLGHPLVVGQLEIDDRQCLLHDRPQERGLDLRAARTAEQVANLGNHRCRNEDRAPREVQTGEQVGTSSVVLVVAISCRNQRASVANDHSGTPESLGEKVVVVAAEVGTAAGERAEPGRRPLTRRHRPALTTSLGEHGLNTVVRQLLDQPPQLVPLGTHTHSVDPGPSTSAQASPAAAAAVRHWAQSVSAPAAKRRAPSDADVGRARLGGDGAQRTSTRLQPTLERQRVRW